MSPDDGYRGLGWKHGALTVQRHAAMLAPITFLLPNGRQVSPMHVAPWAEEPIAAEQPGILQRLRGEWPCVPFGYAVTDPTAPLEWARLNSPSEPGEEIHGHSSNHPWTWEESDGRSLKLSIDYPASSPVKRLVRTIAPDPNAPAVDIELRAEIKDACRLPFGLHPTFRLPTETGVARIEAAAFAEGRTYPGTVEPSAPFFAVYRSFASLKDVPGRDGSSIDASRLPFAGDTEELLQLNGIDGVVALANEADGNRVRLRWQKEHFPSLLLWISNRGRKAAPWNGRHLALGMEPICSPFGLGPAVARADNPMARAGTPTARDFAAGEVFTTRYRIEAEPLLGGEMMTPLLPMGAARVFFDGIFTDPRVAHPEGVAVHADGSIWCGNELGDLLRIAADGSKVERMGTTNGFALGIAFDSTGNCFICDLKHAAVFRYDAVNRTVEKFASSGILVPNYPIVDEKRGVLYVSDSRGEGNIGPGIFRYDLTTGEGGVWCQAPMNFANGMAMALDGGGLYVVESHGPHVSYVPINANGSVGKPSIAFPNVRNVPDGLAIAPDGTIYVSCYEPSRIYRQKPGGRLELLIEDQAATTIAHPTNIALKGNTLYTANLGRWHITAIALSA